MSPSTVARVLDAYGFGPDASAEHLPGGLINHTYVVRRHGAAEAVIQELHPIFAAEVNIDIEAVTRHLAARGIETPSLLRTRDDARWVVAEPDGQETGSGVWRALSYIEGTTLHRLDDPESARSAGALVGRFHAALDDFEYDYAFARAGVHDTARHLARLRQAVGGHQSPESESDRALLAEASELGRDILAMADSLPPLGDLPSRHSHGDLKISNILFFPGEPTRARCIIDLDTLGRQTIAYELGDAMRSWCNPQGEDVARPEVDRALFAAAMAGYRESAGSLLGPAERAAIVPGLETVCMELAARFCVDVFDDTYFGWDSSRYSSRREHNLVRARGQLALARSVGQSRQELARLV